MKTEKRNWIFNNSSNGGDGFRPFLLKETAMKKHPKWWKSFETFKHYLHRVAEWQKGSK